MPAQSTLDGVLVQWGDRLFYPANRTVRAHTPKLTGAGTQETCSCHTPAHSRHRGSPCAACAGVLPASSIRPARTRRRTDSSIRVATMHSSPILAKYRCNARAAPWLL